ncbi:hypothetical protein FE257_007390 [Aspergillus nanangensis]|uniref:FAD-binding domain-containing protein n=1 Tax=Aspergillus nanangensis TaxID=2582783 RepID=A0AAD4CN02_ASPNN|nr:hypothetical protein FE257_007390 [Aspergillus nanangensis]
MSHTITSTHSQSTRIVGDKPLDVANLEVIQLESLIAKDPVETAKLLKAAESQGFFYVAFNDDLSEKISGYLQTCYRNSHEYFSKPLDEKMKTFREDVDYGYKRAGIESFEIPRDEQNSITLPAPFAEHAGPTLDLLNICDTITRTLLRNMSDSLSPSEVSVLEKAHRPDGRSDSGLKFVSGPTKPSIADVPDTTHTDGGSITLLWCEKWASQMQTKDTGKWLWIDPKPDCVLVNVANYLQSQTGSRLHSPVHKNKDDGLENTSCPRVKSGGDTRIWLYHRESTSEMKSFSMSPPQSGISLNITVIGAGIAGLSSAIALADTNPNHQITVLESNASLSEFGAGLQLFPNSTRILNKWGLTPSLQKVACQSSHMSIRRWEDNTELAVNMNNPTTTWLYGWPQLQIYRPDLQQALFERLKQQPNVTILFGQSVTSVDPETGTVRTTDGAVFSADLTVAADGIWSRARRCLPTSKDVTPAPYREHHYRAVIPRARMLSNPVTAPFMASPETKSWVGPGVFVLAYTVASNELYNLVIGVPRPSEGAPLGKWNHPADLDTMRGLVSGWCEEVRELASLVQEGECVSWTLGEVGPIPSYVSGPGRLALVGDAAHALLPHAAQGAGMAMEDAASLAEFVGNLRSTEELATVMSAWSRFRQARVEHLRSISRGNAVDMTLPDGEDQIARDRKWNAIREKQRAQLAELGLEKIREKMLQERPTADPACKSTFEPGGRMWVNGFDLLQAEVFKRQQAAKQSDNSKCTERA